MVLTSTAQGRVNRAGPAKHPILTLRCTMYMLIMGPAGALDGARRVLVGVRPAPLPGNDPRVPVVYQSWKVPAAQRPPEMPHKQSTQVQLYVPV